MPVHLDATVIQSPRCLAAAVGNDLVVMSVEQGLYLALNPVARDIWGLIVESRTVKELCDALVADYDASRETIEGDVLELLDILAKAGLIEVDL